MDIIITKSRKKDKKFDAVIDGKKTISFGAKGYSDFTQHKDSERKQRYLNRHKQNENWNNPTVKGETVRGRIIVNSALILSLHSELRFIYCFVRPLSFIFAIKTCANTRSSVDKCGLLFVYSSSRLHNRNLVAFEAL